MWNRRRIRTIHMICDYRNYSGHNVIIFCSFNKVDSKKLSSFKYKWELLCPFLLKKQFLVSYSLHLSNCSSNLPPPAPPPAHRNLQWQHRCFDGMKGKLCEFYPGSSRNLTCVFSCSVYLSKSFHKPERQKGEIWIQHAFTQQTRVEHLLGIRHSWWGGAVYSQRNPRYSHSRGNRDSEWADYALARGKFVEEKQVKCLPVSILLTFWAGWSLLWKLSYTR